ncbi:MAG TPA: selenium cofactor biosynthesis protein YqeC [Leptolinea sp.]
MKLIDALRVDNSSKISLVGSGGKTSALVRLGLEWQPKALVAVTAHIGIDQIGDFENHIIWSQDNSIIPNFNKTTIVTGENGEENMLRGVDPSQWVFLQQIARENDVPLFMESDGSKTRPLKAPASHEPAIPQWVNHVVVSIGLSVAGKPLNQDYVHRPEIFSSLTGLELNKPVNLQAIVKMLINPQGGLKNIPHNARKSVLLNQADKLAEKSNLPHIEKQLLEYFDAIITASLQNADKPLDENKCQKEVIKATEQIASIILAAGNSHRMGQPKALLNWKGIPFVRACALQAITAGLKPIHIIAGQEFEIIREIVKDLPVQVIQNLDWNDGQSSSVRLGIKSLPKKIGGAIFQLVDQPQIPVTLMRKLIDEHSMTLAPIILPESGGRRANPVLFDRKSFDALSQLQGDIGGKMVFSQFPIRSIPWYDESILMDVDTPEDYRRLQEIQ